MVFIKLNVHGVEVLLENVPCCAIIAWADNNTFILYTVSLVSHGAL